MNQNKIVYWVLVSIIGLSILFIFYKLLSKSFSFAKQFVFMRFVIRSVISLSDILIIIKDYFNNSTESKVSFTLEFNPNTLKELLKENKLEKELKLTSKLLDVSKLCFLLPMLISIYVYQLYHPLQFFFFTISNVAFISYIISNLTIGFIIWVLFISACLPKSLSFLSVNLSLLFSPFVSLPVFSHLELVHKIHHSCCHFH